MDEVGLSRLFAFASAALKLPSDAELPSLIVVFQWPIEYASCAEADGLAH
jgi:hypothetical protein